MRRPMHRQSRHVARAALSAMGATLVAGAGALPLAHATVAAPTTTLVTVDSGGGPANGGSWDPYLSGDGRYVVYWSLATDLVAGDTNGTWDVYLRDTVANTSTRVSRDRFGGDPNGPSEWVNISQDGRYVAYLSFASDIVAGDTNGRADVFRWDQLTGQTVRVSVSRTGGNANGNSTDPFMSGDGRYVTFWSLASNLVTGDGNNMYDVFSRDMLTGTTTRISVDTNGGDPNGPSYSPSISADGRSIDYYSLGSDLVAGDTNGFSDIFVRDMQTGITSRVSVDTNGGDANQVSQDPNISPDGHHVGFYSQASDLVPGDGTGAGTWDLFVRDIVNGVTQRVSVDINGGDPNGSSVAPNLSQDGRYIAFDSYASDLVPGDTNGVLDLFVKDMVTGITTRHSVDTAGGDANGATDDPAISADGTIVTFGSLATDLVNGDTNGVPDVFVRTLS